MTAWGAADEPLAGQPTVVASGVGQVPHFTVPAKPGEGDGRRASRGGPPRTVEAVRAALVRQIAADPIAQQWLREHVATHLRSAASEVEQAATWGPTATRAAQVDGLQLAAEIVTRRAGEHQRGETGLW